ncbi:MAG: ABC transporter permease [Deltaproteobacteria bacterium]|nr:ABC transporter permease [Deltaproteobacteria bacterium]
MASHPSPALGGRAPEGTAEVKDPHLRPRTSPVALASSLWRHRHLVWQLTKRDVIGRYRGSFLGVSWSFFIPLVMLGVYTFVFSEVFNARWGDAPGQGKAQFAVMLFIGIICHGFFCECLNRSPGLILSNSSYVKRVIFPLEVLAVVTLASAFFHLAVNVLVLFAGSLLLGQALPWTAILLPVVLAPLGVFALGVLWFLAGLGVYVRDVSQITGVLTTLLLFISPVLYPLSAVPQKFQGFLLINPLTLVIEQTRQVFVLGHLPDWGGWGIYLACAIAFAWAGFWWFQRVRKGFADVI